jgi:2-dehydropantoate 2-reductase
MKVAIIGLGGVGGYIYAKLLKSGFDVVGFARGKHLESIKRNGIKITEKNDTWSIKGSACSLDEASGYFDVVLFCVKSYDLENAYNQISTCIDNNSILMSISNGVSNGDILRNLGKHIVLDGCVYILSHIKKAGVIEKKGDVFAVVFGGNEVAVDKLKDIFDKANLRNKTPQNIKEAIWKKYIFISAFATMTSYYDKSIGWVYENRYDEAKELLFEIANIAKTKGIDIDAEVEKSLATASKVPYDSTTSMWLDFKNNKQTELGALSGYIVDEGKTLGIKTPIMQKMYENLKCR